MHWHYYLSHLKANKNSMEIHDPLSASEISFAEVQLDAEDFQRYVQWICHSWPAAVAVRGRVQTLPQTNESPC